MSLAIVYTRAYMGITAPLVTVEAHISKGLPQFSIVGLAETAVKESKDRVRSALLNSQFEFPTRRITINLAPADLPKEGSHFDLPIALGILAASGQLSLEQLERYEFAGELALSGALRPIQGALPFALGTRKAKRELILPKENANEAALPGDIIVLPAENLLEVCSHLTGQTKLSSHEFSLKLIETTHRFDMSDIYGQNHAKRALEIAASGGHHLLFVGPPGTGKTMLASRLPTLLPALSEEEALEIAAINSLSKQNYFLENWRKRPFRSPHHSASSVALVGGGSPPRPGEISLAHQGILFLDELPEFNRHALESLREPLESGKITISRAARQAEFPAKFQLIAAMNPCPCGQLGNAKADCRCTSEQIQRYHAKLSGPLLDRIDMCIEVPPLPIHTFTQKHSENTESSSQIRERVAKAQNYQIHRSGKLNQQLSVKEIEMVCALKNEDKVLLDKAMEKFGISARVYHRLLRVARTIADLAQNPSIEKNHILEAFTYRRVEKRAQ